MEQALKSLPPVAVPAARIEEEPAISEPVIDVAPAPREEADVKAEETDIAEPPETSEQRLQEAPAAKAEEPARTTPAIIDAEVIETKEEKVPETVAEEPEQPKNQPEQKEPAAEANGKSEEIESAEKEPAVEKAAAKGETHIVTDAVGMDKDKAREAAFLAKPPDDPGVKEDIKEEEPKSRFRLF